MSELKGAAAERFLARPDPTLPIIMLHGPDRGRVQTRARDLLALMLSSSSDFMSGPMDRIEMDQALLEAEPSRLAEEADSFGMFAQHKIILVRWDDPKALLKTLNALLVQPPPAATIVLAAGDLRKGHPVRAALEASPNAAVIACYSAERKDLAAALSSALSAYGLSMGAQARDQALALLGTDHALSLAEIEKLCLSALDQKEVTLAHVEQSLADSSAHSMQDVVDYAFAGAGHDVLDALSRARTDAMEPSVLAQAVQRQAELLERVRIKIEAGRSLDATLAEVRPAIFFKRRGMVERALHLWSAMKLRTLVIQMDEELAQLRL